MISMSLGVGEGDMQAKSPFKDKEAYKYRVCTEVSRRDKEGLMAIQQHCEVDTVPILQMRGMELAHAWQDLASVLMTGVSSWPPSALN